MQCVGLARKSFLFEKWLHHLINDLLTGLLGPYLKYKALTFMHGPHKLGPYEIDRASYF